MLELASVHGRFQPPHLDHLEYILAALERAKHVVIGITQPDFACLVDCPEDPHRSEVRSNPLSFDERCAAIRTMLVSSGIEQFRFSFVRFPIEVPSQLKAIVSTNVVCFTTIRDQWNVVKVERLRELGYDVRVLWDRSRVPGRNGTEIRRLISAGKEHWKQEVHSSVAEYLVDAGITERMCK